MANTTTTRRYAYPWPHRLMSTSMASVPLVVSAFLSASGRSHAAQITLAAGLVLLPVTLPLILKYFTFEIVVDDARMQVTSLWRRTTIPFAEIAEVCIKRRHMLEVVYVSDHSHNRVTFESSLSNFSDIKALLVEASRKDISEFDAELLIGTYAYSALYRMGIALSAATILVVAVMALLDASFGEGRIADDLRSYAMAVFAAVAGILLAVGAANDFTFTLEWNKEGIIARKIGRKTNILFAEITNVSLRRWAPPETLSIVGESRNTIEFNRFLNDYKKLKRFLLNRYS